MAKPYFHSQSSAKKYGGIWGDYMEIHEFMDSSKAAFPDNRHRALTHNSWFIGTILPRVFGETFRRKSDNKIVNTRDIGEQHVLEDYKFKFIPTPQDFLQEMEFLPWMQNGMGDGPSSHKKIDKVTKLKDKEILNPSLEIPITPIEDTKLPQSLEGEEDILNRRENPHDHSRFVLDGGRRPWNNNDSKTLD